MEDFIGFIFRLVCIVGEFLLNVASSNSFKGFIRFPGKLLYKIIWPPNWFNKMEDDGVTFYIIGIIFYILVGLYVGFYCCH